MGSTGKGVVKSDTWGSYLLNSLQVRMDWGVIKDFGRALMDDHFTWFGCIQLEVVTASPLGMIFLFSFLVMLIIIHFDRHRRPALIGCHCILRLFTFFVSLFDLAYKFSLPLFHIRILLQNWAFFSMQLLFFKSDHLTPNCLQVFGLYIKCIDWTADFQFLWSAIWNSLSSSALTQSNIISPA